MKNELLQRAKYIIGDIISSSIAYSILFVFRKAVIEKARFGKVVFEFDPNYYLGILLIAIFWVGAYFLTGFYRDIFRRSRLKELLYTFNASLLGSVVIFFALILDDWVTNYTDYYRGFLVYFSGQFLITATIRFILSSRTARKIKKGQIWFNTILVGSNENAVDLFTEMDKLPHSDGNKFIGFVSVHNNIRFLIEKDLEHLGTYKELEKIIKSYNIEEVIIAIESSEHEKLESLINRLEGSNVKIKMIPDTYDIISGKVKLQSLGAPLVEIKHELMPLWQKIVKRVVDIILSLFLLLLCSPIILICIVMVKATSKGPILFMQKRLGIYGKEFKMIKFRSMVEAAEDLGPQLSSENDPRITSWGRIMRKYRLDELPQFLNVVFGQMSIVGPRPERRYYVDLILLKAPHYKYVQKVKPGITSWGMVKYGYAENVDQMIQRLKYDIIYIENMNLFNDLKILIYTVLIVLQGRGK